MTFAIPAKNFFQFFKVIQQSRKETPFEFLISKKFGKNCSQMDMHGLCLMFESLLSLHPSQGLDSPE